MRGSRRAQSSLSLTRSLSRLRIQAALRRKGRVRLWKSWAPSDSSLTPTVFSHDLDDEQVVLVERR